MGAAITRAWTAALNPRGSLPAPVAAIQAAAADSATPAAPRAAKPATGGASSRSAPVADGRDVGRVCERCKSLAMSCAGALCPVPSSIPGEGRHNNGRMSRWHGGHFAKAAVRHLTNLAGGPRRRYRELSARKLSFPPRSRRSAARRPLACGGRRPGTSAEFSCSPRPTTGRRRSARRCDTRPLCPRSGRRRDSESRRSTSGDCGGGPGCCSARSLSTHSSCSTTARSLWEVCWGSRPGTWRRSSWAHCSCVS